MGFTINPLLFKFIGDDTLISGKVIVQEELRRALAAT